LGKGITQTHILEQDYGTRGKHDYDFENKRRSVPRFFFVFI